VSDQWREVTRGDLLAFAAKRPDLERTTWRVCFPEVTTWQVSGGEPEARVIWRSQEYDVKTGDSLGLPDVYEVRVASLATVGV